MKKSALLLLVAWAGAAPPVRELSVAEWQDKIAGGWVGRMAEVDGH